MRSGRHRGQPTRHGSRRPRRTSVRHPCRTRLRRHVVVLVVLGRQRAEGARAGRFPALSISHAVNLRGQQAKHNGPLAQLGVGCTSNQPTQTAKPKTPTAQRRGGRGKRTSCSTAGSGGRKLRGSFVLGAGYYSLRDSGGVRWISAQLRDGKTTRGRPAWPTTRRTVAWTSRRRPYHIGQCSVLGCLGAARAPCLSYLGSSSASSAARCRPDGPTRFPCDASLAWDWDWANRRARPTMRGGTCAAKCGCAFSAVKKAGGRVAAFSAVQPPAGLYVRCWMIRDV